MALGQQRMLTVRMDRLHLVVRVRTDLMDAVSICGAILGQGAKDAPSIFLYPPIMLVVWSGPEHLEILQNFACHVLWQPVPKGVSI